MLLERSGAEARDRGEDFVRCFRPNEWFGVFVGRVDMATDRIFELARAAVTTSSKSFVGELGEPSLNEVDPGRIGRGEVHPKARMSTQPSFHLRGSVNRRVVDDEFDVEFFGDFPIDPLKESSEFDGTLSCEALADHFPACHVQCREEVRDAVASVGRRSAFGLSEDQRQQRLSTFQSLNRRLLVKTEHDRMVRRVHVEADDVTDFFDEEFIGTQTERA